MKLTFKQTKVGGKLTCAYGKLTLQAGRVTVDSGDKLAIAAEIRATASRESWAGADGSISRQLETWAAHVLHGATLFTVEAVLQRMVDCGFCVTHAKEYVQSNMRCLLIQASNRYGADDEDIGGQMYFFVHNGHAWVDVAETLEEGQNVVWHFRAKGDVIFYDRTEKE